MSSVGFPRATARYHGLIDGEVVMCRTHDVPRYSHSVPVLTDHFRYPERRLLFSSARLYWDRIELSGWSTKGLVCEVIPMDQVARIESSTDQKKANLVVSLKNNRRVHLSVKHPQDWTYHFRERNRYIERPAVSSTGSEAKWLALAG